MCVLNIFFFEKLHLFEAFLERHFMIYFLFWIMHPTIYVPSWVRYPQWRQSGLKRGVARSK